MAERLKRWISKTTPETVGERLKQTRQLGVEKQGTWQPQLHELNMRVKGLLNELGIPAQYHHYYISAAQEFWKLRLAGAQGPLNVQADGIAAGWKTRGLEFSVVQAVAGLLGYSPRPMILEIDCPGGAGPHHATHEDGGSDEINVEGLSGQLADNQHPKPHASSHEVGGLDLLDHGLIPGLSDDDHPQYLLVDGTRAMTGNLDLAGHELKFKGSDPTAIGLQLSAADPTMIKWLNNKDLFLWGAVDNEWSNFRVTPGNNVWTELRVSRRASETDFQCGLQVTSYNGGIALKTTGIGRGGGDEAVWNVDYLGNVYHKPGLASGGATLKDSPSIYLRSRYWTGAASANRDANILHDITAVTPTSKIGFEIAGGRLVNICDDGDIDLAAQSVLPAAGASAGYATIKIGGVQYKIQLFDLS